MDFEFIVGLLVLILVIVVWVAVIGAFVLVSCFIPTVLHLSGVMWWAMAIVCFIILMAIANSVRVIRSD